MREGAEIDIKYSGYLARQQQQIDQARKQENRPIPTDINYAAIATLSNEDREKLAAIRPSNLGQAYRMAGVSPADVTALMLWLKIRNRQVSSSPAKMNMSNSMPQKSSADETSGRTGKNQQ